ncbi:HlyD family secretion protein [Chitinivorax tropicus]|uniref:HlyD family secretion protein n=1 Tax=Chitinivorax tropicus TaxID=714531 RepID=A0A840MLC2_9PROT|nr:HlyD family efflux transporter periplasmic adaptor subunit [Chitinivorax tropicus]MBB5018295.1 HlyD family secretion protein [Chitinivorax tropicus]
MRLSTCCRLLPILVLAACDAPADVPWQGYIEGEYVYVAAPVAGYLQQLGAPRGSRVGMGQPVFQLEADLEKAAVTEAQAREQAAAGRLDNLKSPRREQEIAGLQAQLQAASVALKLSETRLKQQQQLADGGFISSTALDEARTARDRDLAQVTNMRAQLAAYRLAIGRSDEVRAAEAETAAANAVTTQRQWQMGRKTALAPATGEITETYFQVGEWVPAGQPVVSLLPDDRRKIRFYVPEPQLATVQPGMSIRVRCDGCKEPIQAVVRFIAAQPEFTPPVIYSRDSRAKLVFRVEAEPRPSGQAKLLRPGLPVEIERARG